MLKRIGSRTRWRRVVRGRRPSGWGSRHVRIGCRLGYSIFLSYLYSSLALCGFVGIFFGGLAACSGVVVLKALRPRRASLELLVKIVEQLAVRPLYNNLRNNTSIFWPRFSSCRGENRIQKRCWQGANVPDSAQRYNNDMVMQDG